MDPLGAFSPPQRIGILVAVLGLVALCDLIRHRAKATRWHEYAFLLAAGALGALFGIAHDLVTSSLSPEYFVIGKGIDPGDGFLLRVCELGACAGFVAGAIASAVLLLVNTSFSKAPPLGYRRLAGVALGTLIATAVIGPAFGLLGHALDAETILPMDKFPLESSARPSFAVVWSAHIGAYLGLSIGLVLGAIWIRRHRTGSCS